MKSFVTVKEKGGNMKKIFTLLAFLTIYPCLAQTIQITKGKELGDGLLSMVSEKMQNYHQHKDC